MNIGQNLLCYPVDVRYVDFDIIRDVVLKFLQRVVIWMMISSMLGKSQRY